MNAIQGLRHAALHARESIVDSLPFARKYDAADAALSNIRQNIYAQNSGEQVRFSDHIEKRMFMWLCALMLEDEQS